MDRQTLEQRLVRAEERVASGEAHLAKQKRLIEDLIADGHTVAAASARQLLVVLEESQVLHVIDRDRIVGELAAMEHADGDGR